MTVIGQLNNIVFYLIIQLYFICFIRWASGKWLPQKDTQQNVQVVSGSYNNKMATVSFIRKRNTGDTSKDIMFTDTYCPYFLFASGGNFASTTSGDYSLTKHTWYQSSDNRICIKACGKNLLYIFVIYLVYPSFCFVFIIIEFQIS